MAQGLNETRASEAGGPANAPPANRTGLPDRLKAGVESLSGLSMDDVRVHYNSTRPAQLQALAYTQGTEIHVGAGQERHLPHEAWHVVQQKQGRVRPTLQMKGEAINDDRGLEAEADAMGARALDGAVAAPVQATVQGWAGWGDAPIQRRVGYEFETNVAVNNATENLPNKQPFFRRPLWHAEPDRSHIEFVTRPLILKQEVVDAVGEIMTWGESLLSLPILSAKPRKVPTKSEPELVETPKLSGGGVEELVSKFGFTLEEAMKLNEDYGPEVIANVIQGSKNKGEVLMYAPMIAKFMAKPTPTPKKQEIDPEEELEFAKHDSYRDLAAMDVEGEWLVGGLVSKGGEEEMTASPQVTIGTALERLGEMMMVIPTTELKARSEGADPTLTGRNPEAGKTMQEASVRALTAVQKIQNEEASEGQWRALQGMLALMLSYILTGQKAQKAFSEAKSIAPLMSRVNFLAMYKALAPEVRGYLTPAFVAQAAGVGVGSPVYRLGFGKQGVGLDRGPVPGPSVGAWVAGLAEGTDLMSSGQVVDREVEGSPSMGEQQELDTVGSKTGLVPLELRRIPGGVPLAQWLDFAVQAFELSLSASAQDVETK